MAKALYFYDKCDHVEVAFTVVTDKVTTLPYLQVNNLYFLLNGAIKFFVNKI